MNVDGLEDFGLHYPFDKVWRYFIPYYYSNFTAYPKAGALEDQDVQMMDDLNLLTVMVSYHMRAARLKIAAPPIAGTEKARLPTTNAPSFWDRH